MCRFPFGERGLEFTPALSSSPGHAPNGSSLTQRQIKFKESPGPHGIKFTCPSGEIFIVYGTGKVNIQGKSTSLSAAVKEWYDTGSQAAAAQPAIKASPAAVDAGPDRRVFIVYGRDTASRESSNY